MSHVISWASSLLIISYKTIFLRFGGFMNQLLYIVWNPDLVAFRLGPLSVRWYGLMWAIGIALAFLVVKRLYKEQKIKDELFAPLYIYCFFGILIGARLGHCLFYEPDHFLTSGKGFVEMFLPIRFLTNDGWKYVGYQGLASHGGTFGLIVALWFYVRKTKLSIWRVLDNIAIAREGWHRLVFRLLSDVYLHLPFPHRVHQGDTRSLRGIAAHRYGSDTLHPVYHPRRVLHAKSPQMKTQLFHKR